MDQPRKFKPRPSAPPKPPETISGAARRYHACALAFSRTLGVPLAEALEKYHQPISAIYIETSRCELRLPDAVKLPRLDQEGAGR